MSDPIDANDYLIEYLASIDNLSPEVTHLLKEVEIKDQEVEDIRTKNARLQTRLWNVMEGYTSSDEDSEEDYYDDEDLLVSNKKRRLNEDDEMEEEEEEEEDIRKYSEQELLQRIRDGYSRANQLSDEKDELVGKALNLVKRHMKRMEDDFVALFPHHMLPKVFVSTPQNGNSTGIPSITLLAAASSAATQAQPEIDGALSGQSLNMESEDSQFSLSLLSNPQNGSVLSQLIKGRKHQENGRKSTTNSGRKRGSRTPTYTPNANSNNVSRGGIKFRLDDNQFNTPGTSSGQTHTDFTSLDFPPTADDTGFAAEVTSSFAGISGYEPTYCYCDRISFGEMIGCDGEECPYEWFHISCVGLEKAPKGKWFCDSCKNNTSTQPMKKRKRGRPVGSTKTNMPASDELLQDEIADIHSALDPSADRRDSQSDSESSSGSSRTASSATSPRHASTTSGPQPSANS